MKLAIIRNSDKSPEGLPHKSVTQEIRKLKNEGYEILDERELRDICL